MERQREGEVLVMVTTTCCEEEMWLVEGVCEAWEEVDLH